jgi:hypothetical protein
MSDRMASYLSYMSSRKQHVVVDLLHWMCLSVAILVSVASLVTLASSTADADDDPLDWRPPAGKAQFRKLLSDADYQRLSGPLVKRLPQALSDAGTQLPDHGLKISGVFAPGALEAEGLSLNDVVRAVEGEELWGRYSPPNEKPIRIRFYSGRQNRFRDLQVTADLGFAFSIHRRPDLVYLRSRNRNTAWDNDAYVGLVASSSDPKLAETAWNRALAQGSPRSRVCLASGARLALAQGRPATALEFWYEAENNGGTEPLDPLLGYRVMLANFKLEQARDLARKCPKLLPNVAEGLETLVGLHRGRSLEERTRATPSVQARGMHRRDARNELIGLSPGAEDPFLELLTKRDVYSTSPASDHFTLIDLQLARVLGDFELSVALTLAPSDNRRANFVKLARLDVSGVRNPDDPAHGEAGLIAHVELEVPSGFSIRSFEPGDQVYFPDPPVVADGNRRNSIRCLRVGGQLEVFVNNERVIYQPLLSDVMLQKIQFQVVGASVNVSEFTLDELVRRL